MLPEVVGKSEPRCSKGAFVPPLVKEEFPTQDVLCGAEPSQSWAAAPISAP